MYVINGKGSLVRFIAGLIVLCSVVLGYFVNAYWLLLTAFVGFMLMVSALTGFCPLELILKALGVQQKQAVPFISQRNK